MASKAGKKRERNVKKITIKVPKNLYPNIVDFVFKVPFKHRNAVLIEAINFYLKYKDYEKDLIDMLFKKHDAKIKPQMIEDIIEKTESSSNEVEKFSLSEIFNEVK